MCNSMTKSLLFKISFLKISHILKVFLGNKTFNICLFHGLFIFLNISVTAIYPFRNFNCNLKTVYFTKRHLSFEFHAINFLYFPSIKSHFFTIFSHSPLNRNAKTNLQKYHFPILQFSKSYIYLF